MLCVYGRAMFHKQRSMFSTCVMSGTIADHHVEQWLPRGVLAWRLLSWHSLFNITSKILCWSLSWFPFHYHFVHICAFSTEMHYFYNKTYLFESVSILQKIFHCKFNVVHFSCIYITYVKFNTNMLYVFFWVIPQRLNIICRRFGTLCLFHLHRQVGMKNN
jgi:hypothetical protein